jgi:DNA-binding transcriptional MocR family regulator
MKDILLSNYGSCSTRPSPVNRMMESFAADFRDAIDINLGVGYVNEETIPKEKLFDAFGRLIADPVKHRNAFNYGGPTGSVNLIRAAREFILINKIGGVTREILDSKRIIIGASGATSLLDAAAMVQRGSDIGFSAPLINQEMAAIMLSAHVADQISNVQTGYRDKARKIHGYLKECFGDHIESLSGGSAGFYFYVTLKNCLAEEGSDFFRFCSRTTGLASVDEENGIKKARVIYIPGSYCVHQHGDLRERGRRQLRISYGFEDVERIQKGIDIMREAIEFARSRGK